MPYCADSVLFRVVHRKVPCMYLHAKEIQILPCKEMRMLYVGNEGKWWAVQFNATNTVILFISNASVDLFAQLCS
jgi:hypothetical protein